MEHEKIKNSCKFCKLYERQEIKDGVYTDEPECFDLFDFDEEAQKVIQGFNRDIERDCCKLSFAKVVIVDNDLNSRISKLF